MMDEQNIPLSGQKTPEFTVIRRQPEGTFMVFEQRPDALILSFEITCPTHRLVIILLDPVQVTQPQCARQQTPLPAIFIALNRNQTARRNRWHIYFLRT